VTPRSVIELHIRPLVEVEGVKAACVLYDQANDEFMVFFVKSGLVSWMPRTKIRVDASCFVDDRKVQEKKYGAFPGELGFDPDGGEEG